jgi:hypothetical protein
MSDTAWTVNQGGASGSTGNGVASPGHTGTEGSNPSPSSGESCELSVPLSVPASAAACTRACRPGRTANHRAHSGSRRVPRAPARRATARRRAESAARPSSPEEYRLEGDCGHRHKVLSLGIVCNRNPLTRDRGFESVSLQQTVRLSPASAFEGREPRLSARVCEAGLAAGSAETRRVFRYRANRRQYLCRAIFQYRSAADGVGENATPVPTNSGLRA